MDTGTDEQRTNARKVIAEWAERLVNDDDTTAKIARKAAEKPGMTGLAEELG